MIQFINTLQQIVNSDAVNSIDGIRRHLKWQFRKIVGGFPCELTLASSRLYVDRPGGVAALVNAMGEYDYNNMNLLSLLLLRFSYTFIDVGANVGSYTLIASSVRSSSVISVEPHPQTFRLLEKNRALNNRDNVTCLNIALSYSDSESVLTDCKESTLNRIARDGPMSVGGLRVVTRRMDTVCEQVGVKPEIVKIDVEGHERSVLDGFGRFGQATKTFFIEHGDRPEICDWMSSHNYAGPYFCHFNRRLFSEDPQPRAEDPVFIHPEFLPFLTELSFACQ